MVLSYLLYGVIDLVEVRHLGFDTHFFDGASVAASERVDSVERSDVEIFGNGNLDQFGFRV
jgi:hypothetical protein